MNPSTANVSHPSMNVTSVDGGLSIQVLIIGILGLFTFGLNMFTTVFIMVSKSLSQKEKVCFMAIISSDIFLGFQKFIVCFFPYVSFGDDFVCKFRAWSGIIFAFTTILTSLMVTVERFLCLNLPFRYVKLITSKKLIVVSTLIWMVSIALTLGLFYDVAPADAKCQFKAGGDKLGHLVLGLILCSVVLIDLGLYMQIIRVTRRHILGVAATIVGDNSNLNRESYIKKKEIRATITIGIITLAFVLSYIPMGVYGLYYAIHPNFIESDDTLGAVLSLHMVNSIVNPIIYIWSLRAIRKEMISKILCRPVSPD